MPKFPVQPDLSCAERCIAGAIVRGPHVRISTAWRVNVRETHSNSNRPVLQSRFLSARVNPQGVTIPIGCAPDSGPRERTHVLQFANHHRVEGIHAVNIPLEPINFVDVVQFTS
eukprot:9466731-Pyramimonas_sp.AAC.1